MKKYIYVVRDKKLGAFKAPTFTNEDKEHYPVEVVRSLARVEPKDYALARDMALYYLGEYDDLTAKFDLLSEEEKVLDYEDYLPKLEGE